MIEFRLAALATAVLTMSGCVVGESTSFPGDLKECGAVCGSGPTWVAYDIELASEDADGNLIGYNLDGIVSDGEGRDDCYVKDGVSPSGARGIDNQVGALIQDGFTDEIREALPLLIRDAVGTGGLLILAEMVEPVGNDFVGPRSTRIAFRRGGGIPMVGTDGFLLPHQTFELAPDFFLGQFDDVGVDDLLLSGGPSDLRLVITVFGITYQITLRNAVFDMEMSGDATMMTGTIGGAVHLDDLFGVADTIVVEDLGDLIRAVAPSFTDVEDPENGKCEMISAAARIKMKPAFIHPRLPLADDNRQYSGREIFFTRCGQCHGPAGNGGTGPSLTDFEWDNGDGSLESIRQVIADGVPDTAMPVWREELTDKEIDRVAEYVFNLSPR